MALETWPRKHGPEREARILEAVRSGDFEHAWYPLTLTEGGHTLAIQVSRDALKIDGVRVNMTAETQQAVADELGAVLLTPKLVDWIWQLASGKLAPQTAPISSSTAAMTAHSARVDLEVARRGATGLLANVGKDWVLSKSVFARPGRAANYGWYVSSKTPRGGMAVSIPAQYVIQGVGTAHSTSHVDYSQTARWARRSASLDGRTVDLAEVYTGAEGGTEIISHEGPLPGSRMPVSAPIRPGRPVEEAAAARRGIYLGDLLVAAGVGAALGYVGGGIGSAIGAGLAVGGVIVARA